MDVCCEAKLSKPMKVYCKKEKTEYSILNAGVKPVLLWFTLV